MYFLENNDGLILAEDGGLVDDLDFGRTFETEDHAEKVRSELSQPDDWEVFPDVSE